MFIETELTPNPNSLKFLPHQTVMEKGSKEFRSLAEAELLSPLATKLFQISGVERVFFGQDFIAITKNNQEWAHIKPEILAVIMEHFVAKMPLFYEDKITNCNSQIEEFYDKKDEKIVATLKEILTTRVRPAVMRDGGDIQFHGYKDGVVYLYMRGACAGCPSASLTLKQGVENLLRHFIPDILGVEASPLD